MKQDCYEIITNELELLRFIDWLPDLQDNEIFYLSLFARKKYCPELVFSNDKTQLKRFTSDKDRMLTKIKQLEIGLGKYWLKDRAVPQEALVLYITVNPRDMVKATTRMGKRCWELFRSNNFNLHQEALSCIQKSKSRTCYVEFDIDDKDTDVKDLATTCQEIIGANAFTIIETRGGYHVLVDLEKAGRNIMLSKFVTEHRQAANWYPLLYTALNVDKNSRPELTPVVGCFQGGFTPKFAYYNQITQVENLMKRR